LSLPHHPLNRKEILHKDLSYKIVGLAMEVHRTLGSGFLEKVYENALMVLFNREGIKAEQQKPIRVYFEGENVGDYFADILIEDKIILEIKIAERISRIHEVQILHYLKATGLRLGIIINFGKKKLESQRFVV
jgi:GxxExxY protein